MAPDAAVAAMNELVNGRGRIFVVDDDRGLVRLIEKGLRREGYATAGVSSAQDALAWLATNQADLMLLDLKLENIQAAEVIDKLAASGHLLPFIIITGQGDERVAVEMMKRGALDYVVKDVHFHDIIPTLVGRALGQVNRDRKLVEAERERAELQQQILEISDLERRRIGQDLHDGLGQHLTGIELMVEALEQKLATKQKAEAARAADISKHVRDAIRHTKALARGLSPVEPDAIGLMSALKQLSETSSSMFAVRCTLVCPAPVLVNNNIAATHLFRIAQEALTNAIKHGRARNIDIQLSESDGTVRLSVTSDGTPLPPLENRGSGLGLRIMNYRAAVIGGTLTIEPGSAGGAVVACSVSGKSLEANS